MRRFSSALVLAFFFLWCRASADAQTDSQRAVRGYYASATGMATFQQQTDLFNQQGKKNQFSFSPGYGFAVAVGYQISEPWRVEIELSRRAALLDTLTLDGVENKPEQARYSATAGMLNGYLDIGRGDPGDIQPYLGLGVGKALVRTNRFPKWTPTFNNIHQWLDAFQIIGGISYHVDPRFKLSLDYRLFASRGIESGVVGPDGDNAELEYLNQNVGVCLRVLF